MKIFIYGTVGGEVQSADIVSQIENNTDDEIEVFINSPGGDVNEGTAIYNALNRAQRTAKVSTHIDGLAFSAASWISQAATKGNRFMSKTAQFGIHQASNFGGGNKEELKTTLERLAKIDEVQEFIYTSSSGLPKKAVREIMSAGKILFFKESMALGFVDGESVPVKVAALFKTNNKMNLKELSALITGAKGEETLPEIDEKVKATLKKNLEKAETPAEVLGKDFAKSEDFESYKGHVEPILEGIFEYIKDQPSKDDIAKMVKESTIEAMKNLLNQVRTTEAIPTAEESGFDDKTNEVASFAPMDLGGASFWDIQKMNN